MALRLIASSDSSDSGVITYGKDGTAIGVGIILQMDRSDSDCNATAADATFQAADCIFAVSTETTVAGDSTIRCQLITLNQLWDADTLADTAAGQVGDRVSVEANGATVSSADGDLATTAGVFEILALIGAVGDRRALGRFCIGKQVTA